MSYGAEPNTPSPQEIESQLELILQSKEFSSSEKLKQFLHYVVAETLSGRGQRIKAYNIGLEVFQLGENFDPGLSTVVRVTAGRVRNKLERYYLKACANDKVHIEIPRGSYLPAISYFKPEGHAGGAPLPNTAPVPGAVAAPGAAPKPPQQRPSILVPPFASINADSKSLEPFLRGLAEEIAIALNKYDEFVVVTPQAVDAHLDIWKLAEQTGARFIVKGSAQLEDNSFRLRVALVDAASRVHAWSDKFESNLGSSMLFSIQDEIASQVVARITDSFNFIHRMRLKKELDAQSAGLEVYEAMRVYHYWLISLAPQHFIRAIAAFETAMALEPTSASLKAMLSDIYAAHYQWGLNIEANALDLSLRFAEEALELDNSSPHAHWAKAYNWFLRGDQPNFLAYARKAVALNPLNTNIMSAAGVKLIMLGEYEEGFAMLGTALRLNPHIPSWRLLAPFIVYYLREEYEAARNEANRITTADFLWGPLARAAVLGKLGKPSEGRKELADVLKIKPDFKTHGREIMHRLLFRETAVHRVWEGLQLAGL